MICIARLIANLSPRTKFTKFMLPFNFMRNNNSGKNECIVVIFDDEGEQNLFLSLFQVEIFHRIVAEQKIAHISMSPHILHNKVMQSFQPFEEYSRKLVKLEGRNVTRAWKWLSNQRNLFRFYSNLVVLKKRGPKQNLLSTS